MTEIITEKKITPTTIIAEKLAQLRKQGMDTTTINPKKKREEISMKESLRDKTVNLKKSVLDKAQIIKSKTKRLNKSSRQANYQEQKQDQNIYKSNLENKNQIEQGLSSKNISIKQEKKVNPLEMEKNNNISKPDTKEINETKKEVLFQDDTITQQLEEGILITDNPVVEQQLEETSKTEKETLIKDNPVKQQLEEKPLTFKDVIKKRILGEDGKINDPNKLSVLKNVPYEYMYAHNYILEFANYLINNETYLSSIPISEESKETTPEILDNILLTDMENIEEVYYFLNDLCNDITKIKKEEKEKKTKKFLEKNQKDLKNIKKEVEEKRNSNINTENTILTQSQLDTEEISKNIKSRDEQKELEKQENRKKENKKIKKKEQRFKKLFENKSDNIVIERKKGFVDKDGKYHQFGGFHYEIKNGNISYIIDVNEKELSKLKSRNGGTLKFADLEKCLTLSIAGTPTKSGISTYKIRKAISLKSINENNKDEFLSNFKGKNLDIESKKKAFLKAFGEYVFKQEQKKETDQKFKDYKGQKTIPEKPNEKGQKINYLYYVLTTEPKGKGR